MKKDIKDTLKKCVWLLDQHGENTKQQVKYKLECLIEELKNG